MLAPVDRHAADRSRVLKQLGILDSGAEDAFDELVRLASDICDAPISVVTLLDEDRQYFKAQVGLDRDGTPIDQSICAHAVHEPEFLEIADTTADPRTLDNPLVTGDPKLRFYAGAVLKTDEGVPLGTLCVLDTKPRRLTDHQRDALRVLSNQVMRQIELRAALARQDVLLGEIDHRVKNSLMSVSSMVRLQSSRTDNPEVKDALATVAQRVGTVAAIHEQLHKASNGETVNLAALFARAGGLFSDVAPDAVAVHTEFEPLVVNSADAHSVAIIANEFVANAIKHAFPPDRPDGTITITGAARDENYRIVCRDDGVGDQAALDAMDRSRGLGSRLMHAAIASLRGTGEWTTAGDGLTLTVDLPPR